MTLIESRQNATLRHLARLGREKKYRLSCGEMICEGEKMLAEALGAGVQIKTLLVREGASCLSNPLLWQAESLGAAVFSAQDGLFAMASDVETPQGLVFSCALPMRGNDALQDVSRVLILDGLQDPGNMGTILRTADAFALDAVALCGGCTDPTAPKVVRATMGAAFRLPVVQCELADAVSALRGQGLPVYAAALAADSVSVDTVPLGRCAVIVGNEGRGVSAEALELADKRIVLPMAGRAESLNAGVAASILLWEMSRAQA